MTAQPRLSICTPPFAHHGNPVKEANHNQRQHGKPKHKPEPKLKHKPL